MGGFAGFAHPRGARAAHGGAHVRPRLPHRAATRRIWGWRCRARGRLGISLPNAATAQELMNACAAQGWSDLDHSGLVKALEVLAGHEIA